MERVYLKIIFGGLLALVFLVGGIWGGVRVFRKWQEHRLITQANAFLERGNDRLAAAAASRAYALNLGDIEACRILAGISDRNGLIAAVEWRRRAYELKNSTFDDALAYAKAALRFGDRERARGVLEATKERGAAVAAYHETAAQLAILDQDPAATEKHLAEAARIEPESKKYALTLAVFRLQSPEASVRDAARDILAGLLTNEKLRMDAARALLQDAAQRRDLPAVLDSVRRLQSYPEATLRDRLLIFPVLRQADTTAFTTALTEAQEAAAKDPAQIAELAGWLARNNMALLALDWMKRLPEEMQRKDRVPLALSDCFAALSDWDALVLWGKKPWPSFDYLRHAFLARAARETGRDLDAASEWNVAVKQASVDGNAMSNLAGTVLSWRWNKEGEGLLWRLVDDQKSQDGALAALQQYYTETEDTADLYRVAIRTASLRPDDFSAANNGAQLSLLLNLNPDTARSTARRLYEKNPTNAAIASTHAFGLFTRGKIKEALAVMATLPPQQLRDPTIAAYYGVILAAAGEKEKAKEYLALGEQAKLLPEEKTLVAQAKARLEAP